MAQNMIELISHMIDCVEADATGKGKLAYNSYSEKGQIKRDDFQETVTMLSPLGMMPERGVAISCGETANVLCQVFAKTRLLANECSLNNLSKVVKDRAPRIIRINLRGHNYVIEQIDTRLSGQPMGNVYQSNIAVLSNPDYGITMYKYLHEHTNPVKLLDYFKNLAVVSDPKAGIDKRRKLYLNMFTVPTYLQNPKTKPPKMQDVKNSSNKDVLEIVKVSYQGYRHQDVLTGVQTILKFVNLKQMVASQSIYYRCIK